MEKSSVIGIIGGSGFYELIKDPNIVVVETPWGSCKLFAGEIGSKSVTFLPRHGEGHSVPPHLLNHRSHIYALFKHGVREVFATNAVGSIKEEIKPGEVVIVDQFIDFTSAPPTFFDGEFQTEVNGKIKKGVQHTDMTNPYSERLRKAWQFGCQQVGLTCHMGGTYSMLPGPRFESPAEINALRIMGATVAGMTSVPEVVLCRELEMEYSTACIITNLAAGMQEAVTHEEVMELFGKSIGSIREALSLAIGYI